MSTLELTKVAQEKCGIPPGEAPAKTHQQAECKKGVVYMVDSTTFIFQ